MARPASIVVAVLLVAAAAPADALFWNHAAENVTAVCSSLREAPYKTSACTDFESQVCASVSSSCLRCVFWPEGEVLLKKRNWPEGPLFPPARARRSRPTGLADGVPRSLDQAAADCVGGGVGASDPGNPPPKTAARRVSNRAISNPRRCLRRPPHTTTCLCIPPLPPPPKHP